MTKLTLYTECEMDFLPGYREIAEKVLMTGLRHYPSPYPVQVSLYVVEAEEIRKVNAAARGIDQATDVLSFPNLEFVPGGEGRLGDIEEGNADAFDRESGELVLGEIMICAEKVYAQAEEYGHGAVREFAFLTAHSFLHLLGYDHMTDAERERMEALQEQILKEAGYERK